MKNEKTLNGKNPFYKGFFLFLPLPLAVATIVCATILLFQTLVAPSEYFRVLTNGNVVDSETAPPVVGEGTFPVIPYESQFATLNVEGWERKDIPVYFGDNNAILRKGAGMWINSRFFGKGGKTVLSAHVTSHFYEMEDTAVGDLVTVDTIYGNYVYKVIDIVVFQYQDESLIRPSEGEKDLLVMYTCYPRKNGYQFKTERLALVCRKVEGKDWTAHE